MSAAHTPPPWNVADQFRAAVWLRNHKVLMRDSSEESHANARLIAAAPDMLEALQNLENDDNSIPAHAWALVQAAINKATGGAQ
jgi:hypothetical protein